MATTGTLQHQELPQEILHEAAIKVTRTVGLSANEVLNAYQYPMTGSELVEALSKNGVTLDHQVCTSIENLAPILGRMDTLVTAMASNMTELAMEAYIKATPQRPSVTKEMIHAAATQVTKSLDISVSDVLKVYRHPMDGFDLSLALNEDHVDVDREAMDSLDEMVSLVGEAHRKAQKEWFATNNIQPPLAVGHPIKEGIIEGFSDYNVATYRVRKWETLPDEKSWQIIRFEDVRPLTPDDEHGGKIKARTSTLAADSAHQGGNVQELIQDRKGLIMTLGNDLRTCMANDHAAINAEIERQKPYYANLMAGASDTTTPSEDASAMAPAEAPGTFNREDRYLVIKRKGLDKDFEAELLSRLRGAGVSLVPESVVVEHDNPIYETVWGLLVKQHQGKEQG